MKSSNSETFDFSNRNNSSAMTTSQEGCESSDTFGIAYKPFMPKKNSYELPKGPAFEDEVEFERELQKSSIVAATTLSAVNTGTGTHNTSNESDDEFDFEEVDVNAPRIPFKLPAFEDVYSDTEIVLPDEDTNEITQNENQEPEMVVEEENFRESSKKALAEIKDVYSNGLGDHEIVLLKAQEDKEQNVTLNSDTIMLNMTEGSVIEEIDEEEFERQEEEAEKLEKEKAANDVKHLESLQSQWDNIGIENDASEVGNNDAHGDDKEFKVVKYSEVEAFFRLNLEKSFFLLQFAFCIVSKF